ncbi:MAG: hypothetical protein ACOYON_04280 [Fimbriimonas sp.]
MRLERTWMLSGWRGIGAFLAVALAYPAKAEFTDDERASIVAFWNAPGRYQVRLPIAAASRGAWQVRLTPEGSRWLDDFSRVKGQLRRLAPIAPQSEEMPPKWGRWSQPPFPDAPQALNSEQWVAAKQKWDRWNSEVEAKRFNGITPRDVESPTHPGAMPLELFLILGAPPRFTQAVMPRAYDILFEDDVLINYSDQVALDEQYTKFRFAQGVRAFGTPVKSLPRTELDTLIDRGMLDESEARIFFAVSPLEGGFDSVNTYDTGYVSVGFLQFACLSGGSGSLGPVLLEMKTSSPTAFASTFRRYGIDVTDAAILQVVDPGTGAVLLGPDAAMAIINDKRLIAVFQRAGRLSPEFRVAQVVTARRMYYPAEDSLSFAGTVPLIGKVSDIVRSEAGLATLMDRKVRTGRLDPLIGVLARLAKEKKVRDIRELAKFEPQIVREMRYRRDFTKDNTLSQPK